MGGRRTTGAGKEREGRGEERVNGPVSLFPLRNFLVAIIEAGWQTFILALDLSLLLQDRLDTELTIHCLRH